MPKKSRLWLARELWTRPLVPEYADRVEFQGASAVVAAPFNCYMRGQPPDRSNAAIARIAADYMRRYDLPFIGQWEHTNILRAQGFPVIEFKSADGERVQTQRLVKWQAEQLRRRGQGMKVITIGMPEHLGRVTALQEYFGLEPRVGYESARIPCDPRIRPGAHPWCTSRERFTRYEWRIARPGTIAKAFVTPWEF